VRAHVFQSGSDQSKTNTHGTCRIGTLAGGVLSAMALAPCGANVGTSPVGSCADVATYGMPNSMISSAQQNPVADELSTYHW
jgi:hypothetical protein